MASRWSLGLSKTQPCKANISFRLRTSGAASRCLFNLQGLIAKRTRLLWARLKTSCLKPKLPKCGLRGCKDRSFRLLWAQNTRSKLKTHLGGLFKWAKINDSLAHSYLEFGGAEGFSVQGAQRVDGVLHPLLRIVPSWQAHLQEHGLALFSHQSLHRDHLRLVKGFGLHRCLHLILNRIRVDSLIMVQFYWLPFGCRVAKFYIVWDRQMVKLFLNRLQAWLET